MAHTWVTGEVITAKKLNQLEQTVASTKDTADYARDKVNAFDEDDDGVVDTSKSCLNVAESVVSPITESQTEFPTLVQGEKLKISFGKLIKWMSDARTHFKSNLLTIGNNVFQVTLSGVTRGTSPAVSDDSTEVATTAYVKSNLRRYSTNDNGVVNQAASATTADTLSQTLPINKGGTSATTAAGARTALGLGDVAESTFDQDTTHYLRGDGTWATPSSSAGGVVSVSTGAGLTGGPITSSGTIKAQLKSETASALTAASRGSMVNREFPVGVDSNGDLSVNVPMNEASDYDPTVSYTKGAMVFYPIDGYTYRCKQNTTAGIAPTNTTYWEKMNCGDYCAELNSALNSNYTFGTPVDITNVTSSNPYVAPSDGVIELSGGNYGFVIRVRIDGIRTSNPEGINTYAGSSIVPVKKGQSLYTESLLPSSNNQSAKFYPYVKY